MISPASIQVRFADIDVMGHVNNAVYLNYFEMARMHYFKFMLGENWDWNKDGVILLKNELEYIKPVLLHHNPEISISVEKIGNKSFTLGYNLKVEGESYCKGTSTLVGYDNLKHETIVIPAILREGLVKLKEEQ